MPKPLAELSAEGKPKLSILKFPSDLGADYRAHYVQFSVNQIKPPSYEGSTTGKRTQIFTGEALGNKIDYSVQISPPKSNPVAYISLYMPDTVTASYQNSYQEDDLTDYTLVYYGKAASTLFDGTNKVVSNLASSNFLNTISSNPSILALTRKFASDLIPVDALLKGQGLAINPQVQLLFKATALRSFQFNFIFTPSSKEEAEKVKQIIRTFTYYAAPEIGGGAINNDLFFQMPDTFNINFFYAAGAENKNIHKIDECVLENIDVDYAATGGGWTSYEEGYPVQTRMTLTFKELNIMDKKKLKELGQAPS